MVSYKALNTTIKTSGSKTCHGGWNVDGRERSAVIEAAIS